MVVRYPVVLASASPRRKELLARIIDDFEVLITDVDESENTDPILLAEAKAKVGFAKRPEALVIGSDTIVQCHGMTLGKPESPEHASEMLRLLSGQTHKVTTGVCLIWPEGTTSFAEATLVTFRELMDDEIERYVATGEPMDKAGAYAIQGGAQDFVDEIKGDYDNVVGLPVSTLKSALERILPD